uniref:hypothetical protein n=1 Tax=Cecembia sp. TaxID=1898110 RepID=UPI0025C52B6C
KKKKKKILTLDLDNGIDIKQITNFLNIPHKNDVTIKWMNKRRKAGLKERLKYHLRWSPRF